MFNELLIFISLVGNALLMALLALALYAVLEKKREQNRGLKNDGPVHIGPLLPKDEMVHLANSIKEKADQKVNDTMEHFAQHLEAKLKTVEGEYETILSDLKTEYHQATELTIKRSQEAEELARAEIQVALKERSLSMQEYLQKRIDEETERLSQNIKEYRSSVYNELDARAHTLIQEIVTTVVREGVSVSDHERLVVEALEKAKKEGVLGE